MPDDPDLPDLLLRLVRVLDPVTDLALEAARGSTLTQVTALRRLSAGPLSVSELGRSMGIHRSSASRLVDRLIAAELATREPSPTSGREVVVSCTARGRAVARDVAKRRSGALRTLVRHLPAQEQATVARALALLLQRLERT